MTRKHFIAIASCFKSTRPEGSPLSEAYKQWRKDVLAMTSTLVGFNSNFDRMKFQEACGLEDYP